MTKQICTNCGLSTNEGMIRGNLWIEIILWLAYIVPGIIYSIWRRSGPPTICPSCKKEALEPYNSPIVRDSRSCEWCAETIKREAKICKHCRKEVKPLSPINNKQKHSSVRSQSNTKPSTDNQRKFSPIIIFGGGFIAFCMLLPIILLFMKSLDTIKSSDLLSEKGGNRISFMSFSGEVAQANKALDCHRPKITQGLPNISGRLYGCIGGKHETVKYFINEQLATNEVKNVKLMWNNWTKNSFGQGLHADKKIAEKWLSAITNLFAPTKESALKSMFFSDLNKTIYTNKFKFEYRHHVGPAINEHLLIVSER